VKEDSKEDSWQGQDLVGKKREREEPSMGDRGVEQILNELTVKVLHGETKFSKEINQLVDLIVQRGDSKLQDRTSELVAERLASIL
jgi:hypothetical protein